MLSRRGGRHLRAQERRAEVSARAHRSGCHCQVGVQARGCVCDVLARLKEAGDEARCIGSRAAMRAESCSRGCGMRAKGALTKGSAGMCNHARAPAKGAAHRVVEYGNRLRQP